DLVRPLRHLVVTAQEVTMSVPQQQAGAQPGPLTREDRDYLEALLNERATAALLGASVRTLQNWRITGEGPMFTRISSRCIRPDALINVNIISTVIFRPEARANLIVALRASRLVAGKIRDNLRAMQRDVPTPAQHRLVLRADGGL